MNISADKFAGSLAGQHVLVTGASGFIGSHLVRRLVAIGANITILVRQSSDLWRLQDTLDRVRVLQHDLTKEDVLDLASDLHGTQVVFHLAATGAEQTHRNQAVVLNGNVMMAMRMLQLAETLKVDRFVYCGSSTEYGPGKSLTEDSPIEPTSEYGVSKAAAWMLVQFFRRRHSLKAVCLRPFTVFGPMDSTHRLIPHVIQKSLNGENIDLTGGEQIRDFVFVEDVVDAFVSASGAPGVVGGTFNICTGRATSVKEVVTSIITLSESGSQPLFGSRPYRDDEEFVSYGDSANAKERMGWSAETSLMDGLRETIRWMRQRQAAVRE